MAEKGLGKKHEDECVEVSEVGCLNNDLHEKIDE